MSHSTCFNCNQKVSRYEKYCLKCAETYQQNNTFWKNSSWPEALQAKEKELKQDRLPGDKCYRCKVKPPDPESAVFVQTFEPGGNVDETEYQLCAICFAGLMRYLTKGVA